MSTLGTVLIFKPGVTTDQAKAALDSIAALLDGKQFLEYPKNVVGEPDYAKKPFAVPYRLHEFDPRSGGPVWYIP